MMYDELQVNSLRLVRETHRAEEQGTNCMGLFIYLRA